MEKLKTLNELLDMTMEAEELVPDGANTEYLRSLFGQIKRKGNTRSSKITLKATLSIPHAINSA
jgi:hypothetical protein